MKAIVSFYVVSILVYTVASLQAQAAIVIDTVPVGNAGNAGETQPDGTFGAVAYDFNIGTYEVTNDQYAEFLNSVAATDTLSLFNDLMASQPQGGITQSGVSGSFNYAVKPNMGNKPVIYVSWYDAVRFANWLHNGQGSGGTETGAYTLLGGTTTPSNGPSVTREPGAIWFLPSEDEWYKAAYHKNDGVTGNYFEYPTGVDSPAPTVATANATGDISNPGTNVANYAEGADWNSQNGNVTTVGSADDASTMSVESASPYFTFDQAGNVQEWNEALLSSTTRGVRGGSWFLPASVMEASIQSGNVATNSSTHLGFRVASAAIPEPSPVLYGSVAMVGLACWGVVTYGRQILAIG